MTNKFDKFKKDALEYLANQGIDITWEEAIGQLGQFKDNPVGRVQSEIDSVLTSEDQEIEAWINGQAF